MAGKKKSGKAGKKRKKRPAKYRAPKLTRTERRGDWWDMTFFKPGERTPFMHGRRHMIAKGVGQGIPPKKEEAIASLLRENGLNVARTYGLERGMESAILSRRLGSSLSEIMMMKGRWRSPTFGGLLRPKDTKAANQINRSVAEQAAVLLGKMHALGVTHNHPHEGNFTWRRGKVGLIDFKFAKKASFKQLMRSPLRFHEANVSYRPANDYHEFSSLLRQVLGFKTLKQQLPFFKMLVDQYPLTEKQKKNRLEQIKAAFEKNRL